MPRLVHRLMGSQGLLNDYRKYREGGLLSSKEIDLKPYNNSGMMDYRRAKPPKTLGKKERTKEGNSSQTALS